MKLNEMKQLKNEAIDWSPFTGHYDQNPAGYTPGENVEKEGKLAKQLFVRKFMQKAISGLASGINSGLVDPNITGAAPTTQQPQTPAPAAPVAGAVGNMASQLGGNKPNTMANTPVSKTNTAKPGNPNAAPALSTPAVPNTMANTPVSKTNTAKPGNPNAAPAFVSPQTPAQIRQQKQATATQAARAGMTAKPVTKPAVWRSGRNPSAPATTTQQAPVQKPGMTQDGRPQWDPATGKGAKYDGVTGEATPAYQAELDKQKAAGEEQSKARLASTQSAQQATASPTATTASTPSTATGASAEQAALDKMKQKNPKLAGMMAQAGMDADGNDKMSPQQTAALKDRLKAGSGSTSGQSGFNNYVGGSGERMTGVDKSRAPIFKKIQREGIYSKLNNIFEGILNVNEATGQSISQYIQGLFLEYLHGVKVPMNDPTTVNKFKTLADEVQATYAKDNGKNALTKLADLGWALSHSREAAAPPPPGTPGSPPPSLPPGSPPPPGPGTNSRVRHINKIIPTLSKSELLSLKKNIDKILAGGGVTP